MIGFFHESDGSKSMSRLCMFIGCVGGVISGIVLVGVSVWLKIPINSWLCAVPLSLMIGGCVPYIFNKINETKNQLLNSPELIQKIVDILNKNA